jgi:multiple sugar transport system substrate-binding protein
MIIVAAALATAVPGAEAADLVVWWEKGWYPQEDAAVREIVAAFEQDSGKDVDLVLGPQEELVADLVAAVEAGRSVPDIVFTVTETQPYEQWIYEGRLVELSDAIGHFSDLFDPDALERVTLLDGTTGGRGVYLLPIGFATHHVHAWKSLLERAGFTLADIPKEWAAFWSFWCEEVRPAVRRATGRDDIWGVGLNMSVNTETMVQFFQFVAAYGANYVTEEGALLIDEPEVRQKLIKAIDSYTAVYRRGCTPPSSVAWGTSTAENNALFLAQAVVMTPNETLSIPNALRRERPDDYYKNAATIDWPLSPSGDPFPIWGDVFPAVVFKQGVRPLPRR